MGFLLAVLSVVVAEEIAQLEPLEAYASNTTIACAAITTTLYPTDAQQKCDGLPGCGWNSGFSDCRVDDCWEYSESGVVSSTPSSTNFPCECPTTALSTKPTTCSGTWNIGYPAQTSGSGSGQDFYCQKSTTSGTTSKTLLDTCNLRYLRNGTCTAPFCYLKDYDSAHPEVGKICVQVPACRVFKDTSNILRVNTGSGYQGLCDCFEARRVLGDETACNQNPHCYVANSGTNNGKCVPDPCYTYAVNQDAPDCSQAPIPPGSTCAQATELTDLGGGAQGSKIICVASNGNTSPNKCWNLHTSTATQPGNQQCPVNPNPNPESSSNYNFNDVVSACTGECQVANISTYYYGSTKICVDAEHLPDGGSKILNIPSVLAFLVLVLVSLLI